MTKKEEAFKAAEAGDMALLALLNDKVVGAS